MNVRANLTRERPEVRQSCPNNGHFTDIIIDGECARCGGDITNLLP